MDFYFQTRVQRLPSTALSVGFVTVALGCIAISSPCRAGATLETRITPPAIHLGETAKVSIVVKDGGWTRLLQLPKVADATIIRLGQEDIEGSQDHPIITSNFAIMPSHTGEFTIPGFDVKTQDREVLHVQPMTVEVFGVGQNIPAKYLQQASSSPPTGPASPSPSNDQTLTVYKFGNSNPVVIHFGPDGKPLPPSTSADTNAAPGAPLGMFDFGPSGKPPSTSTSIDTNAASASPTNIAPPLNSAPQAVVSRPSLATLPSSPTPASTAGVQGHAHSSTPVPDNEATAPFVAPAVNSSVIFDKNSDLASVESAAKAGNASAEYQWAHRILNGTARSAVATRLVRDEGNDFQSFAAAHNQVFWTPAGHNRVNELQLSQMDDATLRGSNNPVISGYGSRKLALKSLLDTISRQECDQALTLLDQSARQRNADAFDELTVVYSIGHVLFWKCDFGTIQSSQGIPIDVVKAFTCAQQSAALGSPWGMHNLAEFYATGRGIPVDIAKAVVWMQRSADKGCLKAYSEISELNSDGGLDGKDDGLPRNYVKAYVLGRALQEVTAPGSPERRWADDDVDKARRSMAPSDLLAAEASVSDEVAHLRTVAHGALSEMAARYPSKSALGPNNLTKEQWKAAVPQNANLIALGGSIMCAKEALYHAVGAPSRSQTVEDKVYLYWACTDGEIQVVCAKGVFLSGMVGGNVNDF